MLKEYKELYFIEGIDNIAFLTENAAIDYDQENNPEYYRTKEQSYERMEEKIYSTKVNDKWLFFLHNLERILG